MRQGLRVEEIGGLPIEQGCGTAPEGFFRVVERDPQGGQSTELVNASELGRCGESQGRDVYRRFVEQFLPRRSVGLYTPLFHLTNAGVTASRLRCRGIDSGLRGAEAG